MNKQHSNMMSYLAVFLYEFMIMANIEFRVPYSQRYLFNAILDTNHNY